VLEFTTKITVRDTGGAYCDTSVQAAAPEGSSSLEGSPGFHHPRLAVKTFRRLLCSIKAID